MGDVIELHEKGDCPLCGQGIDRDDDDLVGVGPEAIAAHRFCAALKGDID